MNDIVNTNKTIDLVNKINSLHAHIKCLEQINPAGITSLQVSGISKAGDATIISEFLNINFIQSTSEIFMEKYLETAYNELDKLVSDYHALLPTESSLK